MSVLSIGIFIVKIGSEKFLIYNILFMEFLCLLKYQFRIML
jgi:hypothetical protein